MTQVKGYRYACSGVPAMTLGSSGEGQGHCINIHCVYFWKSINLQNPFSSSDSLSLILSGMSLCFASLNSCHNVICISLSELECDQRLSWI